MDSQMDGKMGTLSICVVGGHLTGHRLTCVEEEGGAHVSQCLGIAGPMVANGAGNDADAMRCQMRHLRVLGWVGWTGLAGLNDWLV